MRLKGDDFHYEDILNKFERMKNFVVYFPHNNFNKFREFKTVFRNFYGKKRGDTKRSTKTKKWTKKIIILNAFS